jgi:hypothetical protein
MELTKKKLFFFWSYLRARIAAEPEKFPIKQEERA